MRSLSDLLETSGPFDFGRTRPLAGLRRLRFSFFVDELVPRVILRKPSACGSIGAAGRGLVAQLVRARA